METIRGKAPFVLVCAATLASQGVAAQSGLTDRRVAVVTDTGAVLESDTLRDVVVTSASVSRRLRQSEAGAESIGMKELASLPAVFGERDVMKGIQLLPGVKSDGDGSSGYQVRGGTTSQNLVTVDGAVVYNSGHLMGFFSAFNDDALGGATLYKGTVPARLGGGVSSVFEIQSRQGDMFRHRATVGVGLLAARVMAEGPIAEGRASYLVAARKSYLDLLIKMSKDYKENKIAFYDVNAKVAWRAGASDNLQLSLLHGTDDMDMLGTLGITWSNTAVAARWFHSFAAPLFLNVSANVSNFKNEAHDQIITDEKVNGFVKHATLNANLTWLPNDSHRVQVGYASTLTRLRSVEMESGDYYSEREQRDAWQNDAWISDEWSLGEAVKVDYGVRLVVFSALGGAPFYEIDPDGVIRGQSAPSRWSVVKTRVTIEPRFNVSVGITPRSVIKAGYSRQAQNIYQIRNSNSMSMPFDRFTMSSNILCPMISNQVSAGWLFATPSQSFDFSADVYYKHLDNVYDYRDGKTLWSCHRMETLIKGGQGRSYGVELCARKNSGRLTGWVAYTLSWTETKIDGINGGKWYDASNDRRHDVSVVAQYRLSDAWTIAATWVFNSGQAITAPSAKYDIMGNPHFYYAERNGFRAPAYHRMDVGASHKKRLSAKVEREINFGMYNLYGRENPFMISFENDDDKPTGTKATQVSLFRFVPSVSYIVKF